jgi:hypothetical protein
LSIDFFGGSPYFDVTRETGCMNAKIPVRLILLCLAAWSALAAPQHVLAAISGPYAVDANTLQLWHLNETAGATSAANAVGSGLTMQGVLNGATLGNAGFTGFGTSLDVSAGAESLVSNDNPRVIMPPHRALLAGAPVISSLEDLSDAAVDDVSLTYADPTTGAFTFEMIIKFSGDYDPTQPFRNVGPTPEFDNPGSYSMQLLTGEGDAGVEGRPFQFRIDQLGINAGGSTDAKLEFNNVGVSPGAPLFALIPTTGPNAINNTDWFHVAAAYNGEDDAANNFTFYWTKLSASTTQANALTTVNGAGVEPTDWMSDLVAVAHDFAIGGESRNNGTGFGEGENFFGQIDEVRISSVARTADQFLFTAAVANNADFDGDGDVTGADFLRWQRNLGATGAAATLANGNANGDGVIDAADLAIWRGQFGTSVAALSAVPEPAGLALIGLCAWTIPSLRRKRRI